MTKQTSRKKLNSSTEQCILIKNRHCCCICQEMGIDKEVIIHHIDGNNRNNVISNLAVLCLVHASKADAGLHKGKLGSGRKLTPKYVLKYKDIWEKRCNKPSYKIDIEEKVMSTLKKANTFCITEPTKTEFSNQYVPVAGEGATPGNEILLVTSLENKYLAPQFGKVMADENGAWRHPGCNLLNAGKRLVFAISLQPKHSEEVRNLLNEKENKGITEYDAMFKFSDFLKTKNIPHQLSNPVLMIRKSFDENKKPIIKENKILWVDDKPSINVFYAKQTLEHNNCTFDFVFSTNQALLCLKENRQYDLIISDLKRRNNRRAGIDLIERLNKSNIKTPVIIFAGEKGIKLFKEKMLSLGITNIISAKEPESLIETVKKIIKKD